MNIITVIAFDSDHEMEEALRIALYEMNKVNEDYQYCVSRERGHELLRARQAGIPYIAVCRKGLSFSENGIDKKGQDCFKIIESNFDIDKIEKDNARILCRGFNAFSGLFGVKPLLSQEDDILIKRWAETIEQEDIGRNVKIVSQKEVIDLIFSPDYEPVFIKTFDKGNHYNTVNSIINKDQSFKKEEGSFLIKTSDRPDLNTESRKLSSFLSEDESSVLTIYKKSYEAFNPWHGEVEKYPARFLSVEGEMITSPVISIRNDDQGTLEYRVFVVNGKVSSISRYLDYAKVEIPEEISNCASEFVAKYSNILPKFYVVDFAQTDKGVELVELNPFERSGRYLQNSAAKMFDEISNASLGEIETDDAECLIPDERKVVKISFS